jgi:assimilatory nitrate reductase catalytic subunit
VVVLRIASATPIPQEWIAGLDALLGLDGEHCLAYSDTRRNISKKALVHAGLLTGLRLTGETAAGSWLRDMMVERTPTHDLRRWLLAPMAEAPVSQSGRGRIVCNCLNVAETEIRAAIAGGAGFAELQAGLHCGTACGSCVPEIRRMFTPPAGDLAA